MLNVLLLCRNYCCWATAYYEWKMQLVPGLMDGAKSLHIYLEQFGRATHTKQFFKPKRVRKEVSSQELGARVNPLTRHRYRASNYVKNALEKSIYF